MKTALALVIVLLCSAFQLLSNDVPIEEAWQKKMPITGSSNKKLSSKVLPKVIPYTLGKAASADTREFKVITSKVNPFLVTYGDARGSCRKLGDGWRLPAEGELYDLRDDIYRHDNQASIEDKISRHKYWSQTPTASSQVKSVKMNGYSTREANDPRDRLGVICILDMVL